MKKILSFALVTVLGVGLLGACFNPLKVKPSATAETKATEQKASESEKKDESKATEKQESATEGKSIAVPEHLADLAEQLKPIPEPKGLSDAEVGGHRVLGVFSSAFAIQKAGKEVGEELGKVTALYTEAKNYDYALMFLTADDGSPIAITSFSLEGQIGLLVSTETDMNPTSGAKVEGRLNVQAATASLDLGEFQASAVKFGEYDLLVVYADESKATTENGKKLGEKAKAEGFEVAVLTGISSDFTKLKAIVANSQGDVYEVKALGHADINN